MMDVLGWCTGHTELVSYLHMKKLLHAAENSYSSVLYNADGVGSGVSDV